MTLKQIASACNGVFCGANAEIAAEDIVTDSRKITKGSVFIALKGEKFDGHNFVRQSYDLGAVCCIVNSDFENPDNLCTIAVEDTYAALRNIAAYYRSRFSLPSVAITGSVGKTSTKDMIAEVLNQHYKVLKTEGNFNNEIGLPLTAFRLSHEDEIAVFEMGMSAFGEISRLSKIAAPETAVLTNIGFSHIEHLGSQENILKAKLEILDGISPNGTVILNADDKFLEGAMEDIPYETLSYGIENKNADMVAYNIQKFPDATQFDVKVESEEWHLTVNVPGLHHVYNALSAILTGLLYDMPMEKIIQGIALFRPNGMRQSTIELTDKIIIKDCYNASPTSMKSGLEVLSVTKPKLRDMPYRKVAVLGDMLELGEFAEEAHKSVGKLCCDYNLDCLIGVGQNAKFIVQGAIDSGFSSSELYVFYDNVAAIEHISDILKPNDVILFKGSRGMRLEEIADYIADTKED